MEDSVFLMGGGASRQGFSVYPGCSRTCSEEQNGLKNHRDLSTSASITWQQTMPS